MPALCPALPHHFQFAIEANERRGGRSQLLVSRLQRVGRRAQQLRSLHGAEGKQRTVGNVEGTGSPGDKRSVRIAGSHMSQRFRPLTQCGGAVLHRRGCRCRRHAEACYAIDRLSRKVRGPWNRTDFTGERGRRVPAVKRRAIAVSYFGRGARP